MSDTHYDNCVGFDSDTHYTSAYDTAILSATVSEYDCYNEFFATRLDYVREGERQTQLLNTNKLMQRYDGIIGGKKMLSSTGPMMVPRPAQVPRAML